MEDKLDILIIILMLSGAVGSFSPRFGSLGLALALAISTILEVV